jgi:RNA-directed DNA polymerase
MVGLRMINGCGTCERKETLGAMNSTAVTGPVMVNGTDDAALGWDAINWRKAERDVTRLRRRIFAAEQAGNSKKVASLQRLMLRSGASTLVSVRRVTQQNAGRATAGVDGQVALTSRDRAELADRLQRPAAPWQALPVKRVYIPKGNKKLRPLGIPPIADRAQQNRVRNALEPQWEARFEARSYGFRPGRGCHDAIEAVFQTASGKGATRLWCLDFDLEAAFDHIDHDHLLSLLAGFPGLGLVRKWLKAGVAGNGVLSPTEEGTPQGGGISPVLLNVALHGMEEAAGVRYMTTGVNAGKTWPGSPVLVRYADDGLVLCRDAGQAQQVKQQLQRWLEPRGLAFNQAKTKIVHLDDGVDFLSFTIRRFGAKLIIKPSAEAITRFRARTRTAVRSCYGANAAAVLKTLAPVNRGWAAYQRTVVSSAVYAAMDNYEWKLLWKWATRSHPNKPKRWVAGRYFGTFSTARADRWVFGDRTTGAYLPKLAWTKIERHVMVKGRASPDDPALDQYWARRHSKQLPPLNAVRLRLLRQQGGRCAVCGDFLLHADHPPQSPHEWEQWLETVRTATRKGNIAHGPGVMPDDQHLTHASCSKRMGTRTSASTATPLGLPEP